MPAAAARMLATLPVRTHIMPDPLPKHTVYMRERRLHGKISEYDRQAKQIRIGKHVYASIAEAQRVQRKSFQTICRMIEDGTATIC